MATLYVLQGPDKGRTIKTDEDVALIGRGSPQVGLTDQTVSRKHSEMRLESGHWLIRDLNSANGTYVNGVRIQQPVRLRHGDQIRMGSTLLVYGGDESTQQLSGAGIPNDLVNLDAGSASEAAILSSIASNEDSVVMAAPDTAYAVKSWKAMRELSAVIGALATPEALLPRVLDILFEVVEVDRGVIFIHDEVTGDLLPEVVRFRDRKVRAESQKNAIIASRTIMKHVMTTREGVLCSNTETDRRFRAERSVVDLGVRSVICVPIVAREQVLGVLHLDCLVARHTYHELELRLVTAIGYQTGLAMENARLVQSLVERERLAAAGETAAHLSHSIKNILQGLRSGGDLVERGLSKQELGLALQGWRILDRNLDRCYNLMLNMLAFSKPREPYLESMQANEIVEDVVTLMQKSADDAKIVLISELDEQAPAIPVDRDGLHQVLLNLVTNAIEAVPRGSGVITVRTRFDKLARSFVISIADNGPGIPEADRERIFEPFHSSKGHGGTGLGLPVARKLVAEHGGRLEVLTGAGGGAEFRIHLLAADARRPSPGDTQGTAS